MGDGGHEAGPYLGRGRGTWGPHQAAVSPAFQDPGCPQPNPRPADTHGSWWDGGLGSLEARERQQGDALALGGGVAGAGGEGSPQGPLPRHQQWPPTSPKQGVPRSKEEGQVEAERAGRGREKGERRKWRREGERGEGEGANGGEGGRKGGEEGENGREGGTGKAGGGGSRPRKGPPPPPLAGPAWGGHGGRGLAGDQEAGHQEEWGRGGLDWGEGATPSPLPPGALALPWMWQGPGVLKPSAPKGKPC